MEKQTIDKAIQEYMERNDIEEIYYYLEPETNKLWYNEKLAGRKE